jgi:AI-2 transport protein TqsA
MRDNRVGLNPLIGAAAFVVIVLGLQAAAAILIPFIFAVFISIIVWPLMKWLLSNRVPSLISVVLVILTIISVLAILATSVGSSISEFSDRLPFYENQLKMKLSALVDQSGQGYYLSLFNEQVNNLSPMELAGNFFSQLQNLFSNFILIIFSVIFLLLEASSLPSKMSIIFSKSGTDNSYLSEFTDGVLKYIGIKTLLSAFTGLLVTVFTYYVGLDFPVLWGLTAFMLNYIPTIGSLLAAIPAVALALIQLGGDQAVTVALGYLVINLTIGSFFEPRIMGEGLGLSPLVVFLSLVFWGWIFGPVGMLLSVPLTMTVKIACGFSEKTRSISILLSGLSDIKKD